MRVDAKGRIVIPAHFRAELGLHPGAEVVIGRGYGHITVRSLDLCAECGTSATSRWRYDGKAYCMTCARGWMDAGRGVGDE